MKIAAFCLFVVVPSLFFVYHFSTRKFLNPYKLIFIFGKKGSGKSTLLTKYALMYLKRGWNVYSTENCPGTFRISPSDVGYAYFPPRSVIIVDEVGMIWDNRGFKSFPPEVRDYFKLQRHYKHCVILASQTFDVDKKIRDLSDEMYLVEKKFRVFSYAKKILRKTVLLESTASQGGESRISEDLVFDSLLLFWAGSRRFTYIPKYTKYFDSFHTPELPRRDFEKVPDLVIPVKNRLRFVHPRGIIKRKALRGRGLLSSLFHRFR